MRQSSRAAAAPDNTPSPPERDAPTAVRAFELLQRTIGNRAVADLVELQRQPTPTGRTRPAPPPVPTTDEISAEIGSALGGPYADYAAFKASLVVGKFLGHTIDSKVSGVNAVRPEFQTKLDDAKTKVDAEFAASKQPIPTGYGISSVGGFRSASGQHGWGMAIDVDVAKNPFVMHELGEGTLDRQLAPVYHRIAEFMLNSPIGTEQSVIPTLITSDRNMTATSPAGRRNRVAEYYDRLVIESDAMKEYFALMNDSVKLAAFLAGTWKTKHPSATPPVATDVVKQMWEDYATLGGAIPRGGPPGVPGFTPPAAASGDRPFNPVSAGQQDPAAGFLSIPREVVLGTSQAVSRWGAIDFGGESGDVMHFDDGNGLGRTIAAAKTAATAKLVAKAAAAAAAATPATGTPAPGTGSATPTVSPLRVQRWKEPGEGSEEGGILYPDPGPAALTAAQRLSGAHWLQIAEAWPNSTSLSDLESGFASDLGKFLDVLTANGIGHEITAGFRPPQRSFLFHWCVKVQKGLVAPADVPKMDGVDINWDHGSAAASRKAASEMASAFGLVGIAAHPSNHNGGTAIDMKLDFSGNTTNKLTYAIGTKQVTRTITSAGEAKVGESAKGKSISDIGSRELSKAGADFGVKRALDNDIVHWSRSGR